MTEISKGAFKDFDKFKQFRRLGIFDSGVGGLSILKQLHEHLDDKQAELKSRSNNKEIVYIADTARFPYGTKTAEQIAAYTKQIILTLEKQNVEGIVFGCNTASAIVGKHAGDITDLPVLDLIEPVSIYVSQLGLKVGILATEATVKTHAFTNSIYKHAPNLQVKEIAATELVSIVESGKINEKRTQDLLSNYIDQFCLAGTEVIVLSCTHFSFLKDSLSQLVSKHIRILDPAELILKMLITDPPNSEAPHNELNSKNQTIKEKFFVTGSLDSFSCVASKLLGYPIKDVSHLSLASPD